MRDDPEEDFILVDSETSKHPSAADPLHLLQLILNELLERITAQAVIPLLSSSRGYGAVGERMPMRWPSGSVNIAMDIPASGMGHGSITFFPPSDSA